MLKQSARARNIHAVSSPALRYNPGPLSAVRAASSRRAARRDPCTSFSRTTARSRPAPFSPTMNTSLQVEAASGKRLKIKAASVLLRFAEPVALGAACRCTCSCRRARSEFPVGGKRRSRVCIHRPGQRILRPCADDRRRRRRWRSACMPRRRISTRRARAAIVPPRPTRSRPRWRGRSASAARRRRSPPMRRNSRRIACPRAFARSPADAAVQAGQARARDAGPERSLRGAADRIRSALLMACGAIPSTTTSTSTASCSRRFRTARRFPRYGTLAERAERTPGR